MNKIIQSELEEIAWSGQKASCADFYEFRPGMGFVDFRQAIAKGIESDAGLNPTFIGQVAALELSKVLVRKIPI